MRNRGNGRDDLFDSAWLKWAHAVGQAHALKSDIYAAARDPKRDPNDFALAAQYDPKRHGFAVTVARMPAMAPRWALTLGDVAHNFRSVFDQVAWAMVQRTTPALTERQARNVYFPISDDRTKFNSSLKDKLPGVGRMDIAFVRALQPYHARTKAPHHFLTILSDLNNGDKHRTVQPMWMTATGASYKITHARDCEVTTTGLALQRKRALELDAEVAFIRARKRGPEPHMEVQGLIAAEPSLEASVFLNEWIQITQERTATLLTLLASPPADLIALGIDIRALGFSA